MNNNQNPQYKYKYPIGDVHFNTKEKISIMTGKESYLKDRLKKLKKIKDSLPNEHDGSEPILAFINKYYYDIVECSLIAEKELPLLNNGKYSFAPIVGIISGFAIICCGTGMVPVISAIGIFVLSCILHITYSFIVKARRSKFQIDTKDLFEIRSALEKIRTSRIPDKYKSFIEELIIMISSIDVPSLKITHAVDTKECVDMKLKIHEAFIDGAITESQRDILLDVIPC